MLSMAAGLVAGKEGPFVHSGAIVGGGWAGMGSTTLTTALRAAGWAGLSVAAPRSAGGYFRSDADHRDFVFIGAAAGGGRGWRVGREGPGGWGVAPRAPQPAREAFRGVASSAPPLGGHGGFGRSPGCFMWETRLPDAFLARFRTLSIPLPTLPKPPPTPVPRHRNRVCIPHRRPAAGGGGRGVLFVGPHHVAGVPGHVHGRDHPAGERVEGAGGVGAK